MRITNERITALAIRLCEADGRDPCDDDLTPERIHYYRLQAIWLMMELQALSDEMGSDVDD